MLLWERVIGQSITWKHMKYHRLTFKATLAAVTVGWSDLSIVSHLLCYEGGEGLEV